MENRKSCNSLVLSLLKKRTWKIDSRISRVRTGRRRLLRVLWMSFAKSFGFFLSNLSGIRSGSRYQMCEFICRNDRIPSPMVSTTLPTLSQATSAQKRTLIAASMGWALDAFDVMLYSLVIAHVMTAFGISKAGAGLARDFHAVRLGSWRTFIWFYCRSHWPHEGAHAEHPDLFDMLTWVRTGAIDSRSGIFPLCAWAGHGR